jgi:hypothetical protein
LAIPNHRYIGERPLEAILVRPTTILIPWPCLKNGVFNNEQEAIREKWDFSRGAIEGYK